MARFEWNRRFLDKQILQASSKAMEESCELLTEKIKLSIKEGNNPSMPWHPPLIDTKLLRDSISYQTSDGKYGGLEGQATFEDGVKPPGRQLNAHVGVVGTNLKYGFYLEGGTSKMMPRPYLRPALVKTFNKIKEIIEKNGMKFVK